MSYCRFSSDDWKSDVYCYADVGGGYTTHVAGNRTKINAPEIPDSLLESDPKKWLKLHKKQMKFLEIAEREDINLPHAGETFNDPDLKSFQERLLELKNIGYYVPDYATERIKEEIEKPLKLRNQKGER